MIFLQEKYLLKRNCLNVTEVGFEKNKYFKFKVMPGSPKYTDNTSAEVFQTK